MNVSILEKKTYGIYNKFKHNFFKLFLVLQIYILKKKILVVTLDLN